MNHEPFSKQVGMKINQTWTLDERASQRRNKTSRHVIRQNEQ
jgi:hypothetical protein